MRCTQSVILTGLLTATLAFQAVGQPAAPPATAPTTAPASTQPRRQVIVPPGFESREIQGIRFIFEPADEPVIQAALKDAPPATMPSTRPADMLERLAANRESLKTSMMTDLALTDPAPVDKFLDDTLANLLTTHRDIHPATVFLVISEIRLKEILRGGWSDPRFYYNRAGDKVEVNWNMSIALDRDPDDSLVPAVYLQTDPPDQRQRKIGESVSGLKTRLSDYIASHAADDCYNAFMDFTLKQTVEPVRQKLDREWIASGLAGLLTCHYASTITGRDFETMVRQISAERPDWGLPQSAVDLLHPLDPSQMRPDRAPVYFVVYTRKAIRICNDLVNKSSRDVIPKILTEIRKNPPADGAALVGQIKQITGADLTNDLRSGR